MEIWNGNDIANEWILFEYPLEGIDRNCNERSYEGGELVTGGGEVKRGNVNNLPNLKSRARWHYCDAMRRELETSEEDYFDIEGEFKENHSPFLWQ